MNPILNKRTATILGILIILLSGCINIDPRKKASERMHAMHDSIFKPELNFIVASIPFLCYSDDINYWYSEDVTQRQVLEDKFRRGIRGLNKLSERAGYIKDYAISEEITNAVNDLQVEIKKEKASLKKAIHTMNQMNFFFGDVGGFGTLMDIGQMLNADDYDPSKDYLPFPKEIKARKDTLFDMLVAYKQNLQTKHVLLVDLSISAVDSDKISDEVYRDLQDTAYALTIEYIYGNEVGYENYECLDIVGDYFFDRN